MRILSELVGGVILIAALFGGICLIIDTFVKGLANKKKATTEEAETKDQE